MIESSADNDDFCTAAADRVIEYHRLEARRIRRARLQTADVAFELGRANPPFGASATRAETFGVAFSDEGGAAGTELRPL